jgi:hypothetical protein
VTELEQELAALAAWVEFPSAPDVLPAVSGRIARRRRTRRAGLSLAVALVAVAAAVFAASPDARSSILRWIGIQGVEIERVPTLPPVASVTGTEAFGRPATRAAAREAVDFRLRLPKLAGLRDPDRAYADGSVPDGLVTFVWGPRGRPRLLLSEWRGNTKVHFHKLVKFAASTKRVRVDGDPGIWVSGPPHAVFFRDADGFFAETPVRLAGNVLLWMHGDLSYRLELDAPLADALTVAKALRQNE